MLRSAPSTWSGASISATRSSRSSSGSGGRRGATARGYAATGRFASVPPIPGPLLAGKGAVVTGGGGGIGSAVSQTFAAHRAAVVVAGVDEKPGVGTGAGRQAEA